MTGPYDRPLDDLVYRWLGNMGTNVRDAYTHDPTYHAQVTFLRRLLSTLEMAMEDEQIPAPRRERILLVVVYGGMPDEAAALQRMEQTKSFLPEKEKIRWGRIGMTPIRTDPDRPTP